MKRLLLILCLISIGWTNDSTRLYITNSDDVAAFNKLNKWSNPTNILIFEGKLPKSHILFSIPAQRDDIQFFYSNKCVITIHMMDGRIELADHMTTNEAARMFWKVVQDSYGTYKTK